MCAHVRFVYKPSVNADGSLLTRSPTLWIKKTQTVYIQRGHGHTRTGNWSESGFGSLRRAPLNISRCLGGGVDAVHIYYYHHKLCEKDSEAVLGVWLPVPLPTPRALPDHGALWPLAVGVEKDLGGTDVWPCGIVCCSLCGLTHPPSILLLFQ